MVGVNQDNLEVLVHAILINPVGVEDAEVTAAPANTFLRDGAKTSLELEVVNTLADGLAVGGT